MKSALLKSGCSCLNTFESFVRGEKNEKTISWVGGVL